MSIFSRVTITMLTAAALCVASASAAFAQAAAANSDQPSEETWNNIKGDIFKDRAILDGTGFVILEAPKRAQDAAIVPISMRVNLPADDTRTLQAYLGHRSIQSTVRYTELAPNRFKNLWRT